MERAANLAANLATGRARAVRGLKETITAIPLALRRLVSWFASLASVSGLLFLAFLGLFIVHQATLWTSVRPAVAFERAKAVVYVAEVGWNAYARWQNALIESVDTLVPLWNAASNYVVEPAVYIVLDIFSQIFTGDHYAGLISESDIPYAGFECTAAPGSPAWCGQFDYYEQRLTDADASGPFATESIVLGVATARRLQEATGETIIPVLDVDILLPALAGLSSTAITLLGSVADLLMHVIYTVLSEVAVLLWDAVFMVSKALVNVLLTIVRSGMLQTVIEFGIDLILIMVLEIALPLLFVAVDVLMCAMDLFFPTGWDAQLQCIDEHCFESSSDQLADLIVFTSVPIVWERFKAVISATVNSNTGKKYGLGDLPGLDWADAPAGATFGRTCAECFTCKVTTQPQFSVAMVPVV